MSEPRARAGAGGAGASPAPTLSDLGSQAEQLQQALRDGRDPGLAPEFASLLGGWQAWLAGGDAESALLRSVLDAVAGWQGGGLSREAFELAISRLWAARLDEIAGEGSVREEA